MGEQSPLWLGIIGVVTAVFFGLCTIYYLKEIFIRKPALIISDEGIMDRSSFVGAGLVRWEEIEYIDLIVFGGQPFLGIFTHDPELIVNRTSGIKSLLNSANKKLVDAQVNIPVNNLACSMDNFVDEINNRWQLEKVDPESE